MATGTFISRTLYRAQPGGIGLRKSQKNDRVQELIADLKRSANEHDAPVWRAVANRLERPRASWAEVNLARIERVVADGESIVVPGKVLGGGTLSKKVTVASVNWSPGAEKGIVDSGGSISTIPDMVEKVPKGSGVRIIG
ncbi:MAG: 50S ribosomal protein L18e [Thermoplasmata archaeon]|nr:50S ribosomal protein L18e [Thermoplasmata archaeon]